MGRRFTSAGVGGPPFRVNSATTVTNRYGSSVAMNGNGVFVATWQGQQQPENISRVFVALSAKLPSSVSLTSSANPSTTGQSVTFTATVTPTVATGTITFKDGTATLGSATLASGSATFTTTALSVGAHSITATYSGDDAYEASTSSVLTQTVYLDQINAVLNANATSVAFGTPITFSQSSTQSDPRRTLTSFEYDFDGDGTYDQTTALASASFNYSYGAVGTFTAKLRVTDDLGHTAIATRTITVSQAPTAVVLTSSPNPSNLNQASRSRRR